MHTAYTSFPLVIDFPWINNITSDSDNHRAIERRGKRMHGKFPRNLEENRVDNEQSYQWLKFGDSEGQTEIIIVAAEDQKLVQTILKIKF